MITNLKCFLFTEVNLVWIIWKSLKSKVVLVCCPAFYRCLLFSCDRQHMTCLRSFNSISLNSFCSSDMCLFPQIILLPPQSIPGKFLNVLVHPLATPSQSYLPSSLPPPPRCHTLKPQLELSPIHPLQQPASVILFWRRLPSSSYTPPSYHLPSSLGSLSEVSSFILIWITSSLTIWFLILVLGLEPIQFL